MASKKNKAETPTETKAEKAPKAEPVKAPANPEPDPAVAKDLGDKAPEPEPEAEKADRPFHRVEVFPRGPGFSVRVTFPDGKVRHLPIRCTSAEYAEKMFRGMARQWFGVPQDEVDRWPVKYV